MRRVVTPLAAVVGVALLTAASAHAAPSRPAASTPPTFRVTLIGDSIATAMYWFPSARAIAGAGIDLHYEVAVCRRLTGTSCPHEGERPPTLVDVATKLGPSLGKVVVVAVGYNDFQDSFAETVEEAVNTLLAAGVERILWVTLRAERHSYLAMNEVIGAVAARHPEMVVVDWNTYSRSHPEWFQNDGLHLTPLGGEALATLIRTSLEPFVPGRIDLDTKPPPAARVGTRYVSRLRARGDALPLRWRLTSGRLPAGLRLLADGRVLGIPRKPGRSTVVVTVTDARGTTTSGPVVLIVRRR